MYHSKQKIGDFGKLLLRGTRLPSEGTTHDTLS